LQQITLATTPYNRIALFASADQAIVAGYIGSHPVRLHCVH